MARWIVDITDSTDALDSPDRDPVEVEFRSYKTRRGASAFIDRFACDLRRYFVLEHVETANEIYLRCGGMRPTDQDARIYEVVARAY
jgi:hypothetical protein